MDGSHPCPVLPGGGALGPPYLIKQGNVEGKPKAVLERDLVSQRIAELLSRGRRVCQQGFGGPVHECHGQHDGLLGLGGLQFQPAGWLCACPIDEGPPEPLLTVWSVARRPPVDEVPQVLQTEDWLRGPAPASLTWTSRRASPSLLPRVPLPTLRTCCSRHSAHTPLLSTACCRPQDHIHLPQVGNMATISWPPASPHTDPLHLP